MDAELWIKRWPHYCTQCNGWGGSSYEESHGFRGGGTETIFEPCDAEPISKCHRCGAPGGLDEEGDGPCCACGWNYDDGVPEVDVDGAGICGVWIDDIEE